MRVVVTGARGLLGWHASVRLHAANCTAQFKGFPAPYDKVELSHAEFENDDILVRALSNADAVLHFAGLNRAENDKMIEATNPAIARRLKWGCEQAGVSPHIVYANSTHATTNTAYGRSKAMAADILQSSIGLFTDLILPHIFGEGARPYYNNVTATFIDKILKEEVVIPNPDGKVQLLHAGEAAQQAIDAIHEGLTGRITPSVEPMRVPDLLEKLMGFHHSYQANIFPNLQNNFDLALFNSYRASSYPNGWPIPLELRTDHRGILFEAIKGGGGGQSFLSTTLPGVTRGNHFHINKVERFLVVQGKAKIRIRKVLSEEIWEYHVNGNVPVAVDMPTLHTHSIENVGNIPLLTLFWTHDLFDPNNPDTYADEVLV